MLVGGSVCVRERQRERELHKEREREREYLGNCMNLDLYLMQNFKLWQLIFDLRFLQENKKQVRKIPHFKCKNGE